MAISPQPAQQTDRPAIHLIRLGIDLSNPSTAPSLVNPDFLRHNGIVEPTWTVTRPVVMDNTQSHIRYSNGLVFFANNDHVLISQNAVTDEERNAINPLSGEDVVCFSAASRYIESVSQDSPYDFMSIDPTGWIDIGAKGENELTSPLEDLAARIPVGEQVPDVQVRVQYSISGKIATIYVSEHTPAHDDSVLRLVFSGEIAYYFDDDSPDSASATTIAEILGNWEEDLELFRELVYQIYSTYIPQER